MNRTVIGTLLLVLALAALGPVASQLDLPVQQVVQQARTPWLDPAEQVLSNRIGRPDITLAVLLGFCVFGGPAGVETAQLTLAVILPVNAVVEGVKRLTFRTRPDGDRRANNSSYPSGHSANVFGIATVMARRQRRWAVLWWVFAVAMATSRIYLNRHWFSDVVVGATSGILVARAVIAWWDARRQPPPESMEPLEAV